MIAVSIVIKILVIPTINMADSSQKMGVSCARQAGISGASLGPIKKTSRARGKTTPLTLPSSAAQVKTGSGHRAGEEREKERERERERKEGEACGAEQRQRNRRWTNILIYLHLLFDPPRRVGLGAPDKKRINKSD